MSPPTVLKTKEVGFSVGDPAVTTFNCQFRTATLTDTTEAGDVQHTLCPDSGYTEDQEETWELNLVGLSDWSDNGFSQWAWEHRGQTVDFEFVTHPDKPLQTRTWSGKTKVLAPAAGGESRTTDTFDLTWPAWDVDQVPEA